MDIDGLKKQLQEHLTDGLVTVVGTGLSVAEGLPGMPALAAHLREAAPKASDKSLLGEWQAIGELLDSGVDLENALAEKDPSDRLQDLIGQLTATFILEAELATIEKVVSGRQILRFTRLLEHMVKSASGIPVITTNYDRLLEMAAEQAGLGVDALFVGKHFGTLNPKESGWTFCRGRLSKVKAGHARLKFAPYVKLLKPHGSLDWYDHSGDPVRSPYQLPLPRLIITPGLGKYRAGYDTPFDKHRECANSAIDKGTRYLIIGYGFNDSHLETHLVHELKKGKPAVILAKGLSENAKRIIRGCDNVLALSADETGNGDTKVTSKTEEDVLSGEQWWDVDHLIDKVLKP